jgi:hypothetical protein
LAVQRRPTLRPRVEPADPGRPVERPGYLQVYG